MTDSEALWWPTGKSQEQRMRGPVAWAILHGRATQHAVTVSADGVRFVCMARTIPGKDVELRRVPFPRRGEHGEIDLCRRRWCRIYYARASEITADKRAELQTALQKIEEELEHGEALS